MRSEIQIDIERCALACMILNREGCDAVTAHIGAEHFWKPAHQIIATAIISLRERGRQATLPVLKVELEERGELSKAGGVDYLVQMCEDVPQGMSNAGLYANLIREHWQVAESARIAKEIAGSLSTGSAEERLNAALDLSGELDAVLTSQGRFTPSAIGSGSAEGIAAGSGIPTPWPKLNHKCLTQYGGLPTPGLVILNGYRGSGKTMVACDMALHAIENGYPVLFVSLEMTENQLERRLLKMLTGSEELPTTSDMFEEESEDEKWRKARNWLAKSGFYCVAPEQANIADITRTVKAWHREHRRGMVVIDYVQLIEHQDKMLRGFQKTEEVALGLGRLARALSDTVTVALSQTTTTTDGKTRSRGGPEWENPAHLVMVLESDTQRDEYHRVDVDTGFSYYRCTLTKVRFGKGTGSTLFLRRDDEKLRTVEDSPVGAEADYLFKVKK